MSVKARSSGRRLSENDASVVKGMIDRGDRKHDIAAWFGVNPGRIAEVQCGALHPESQAADPERLPPPGPYSPGHSTHAAMAALRASREALVQAVDDIDAVLWRLDGYAGIEAADDRSEEMDEPSSGPSR